MTRERTTTVYTAEEWEVRLKAGVTKAIQMLPIVQAVASGPGEAVLALMFAARSICEQYPEMPEFTWYARQVHETAANASARARGAS